MVDHTAVDRRNAVLARLQAANPGRQISHTLPVMPYGLTDCADVAQQPWDFSRRFEAFTG